VSQQDGENLDALFEKKKSNRKKSQLSTAENKSFVEAFLGRMEAAAEDDVEAHKASRPAIHKLQLLRQVRLRERAAGGTQRTAGSRIRPLMVHTLLGATHAGGGHTGEDPAARGPLGGGAVEHSQRVVAPLSGRLDPQRERAHHAAAVA
jgi:hypothetical protein